MVRAQREVLAAVHADYRARAEGCAHLSQQAAGAERGTPSQLAAVEERGGSRHIGRQIHQERRVVGQALHERRICSGASNDTRRQARSQDHVDARVWEDHRCLVALAVLVAVAVRPLMQRRSARPPLTHAATHERA